MKMPSMRAVLTATGVGVLLLLLPILSAFLVDAIQAGRLRPSASDGTPEDAVPAAPPLPAGRPATPRPAPPVTPKPDTPTDVAARVPVRASFPAATAPETPVAPPAEPPRGGNAPAERPWPETLRTLMEKKDFQQALTYLLSLPPDQQAQAGGMLFDAWARQDPEAAVQAAQRVPETERQAILNIILGQWVHLQPEAALAYLASSNRFSPDFGWQIALLAISARTRGDGREPLDEAAHQRMLASAFAWLNRSGLDDVAYDRAIVQTITMLSHNNQIEDAATVLIRYAASGRMSAITDPAVFEQMVWAAKGLGGSFGMRDYAAAVAWGRAMPANSAAQAYFLSNVVFSQAIQGRFPDISWLADMEPGVAQVRVIAATAMGLLNASGETTLGAQLKRQLDSDRFDPNGIAGILQQSSLPEAEKRALLAEITRN
jgi:hypothetical protein